MTKEKQRAYDILDIMWTDLDGFKEIWNKADFNTKENIVNSIGKIGNK